VFSVLPLAAELRTSMDDFDDDFGEPEPLQRATIKRNSIGAGSVAAGGGDDTEDAAAAVVDEELADLFGEGIGRTVSLGTEKLVEELMKGEGSETKVRVGDGGESKSPSGRSSSKKTRRRRSKSRAESKEQLKQRHASSPTNAGGVDNEDAALQDAVTTMLDLEQQVETQRQKNAELEAELRALGGGSDNHIIDKIAAAEKQQKSLAADLAELQESLKHLNDESEKASAALLSEEGMTIEFKRNIETWIADLKEEVVKLKAEEQRYATCMDELVQEGMVKTVAKADADRAKYEAQLEAAEAKAREAQEQYEYESDIVQNFDQKEADLVASMEQHSKQAKRAKEEISKLKKAVMKHRKRGKDLADELGRLQGETRFGDMFCSHTCASSPWFHRTPP